MGDLMNGLDEWPKLLSSRLVWAFSSLCRKDIMTTYHYSFMSFPYLTLTVCIVSSCLLCASSQVAFESTDFF